jgi:hypothetical protein
MMILMGVNLEVNLVLNHPYQAAAPEITITMTKARLAKVAVLAHPKGPVPPSVLAKLMVFQVEKMALLPL